MEEGVVPQSTILTTSSDFFMDLDYMDELFLEGCWIEANRSDFGNLESATPISPFDPSFVWPVLDSNFSELEGSPGKGTQDVRQRSLVPENLSISPSQGPQKISQSRIENIYNVVAGSAVRPENHLFEGSEVSRRWWIDPRATTSVMERLVQALGYIKDCSRDKDVLIQVWVPVTRDGKRVLTTSNQPFSLDLNCPRLAHYREISVNYQFPAEEDSKALGLPGRVFRSKVPEWTPDVRFFTRDEYPRVRHAQQVDVRGTLAVPILEQGSQDCLGVIEVVMTTQKIQYRPELETVCKALEAVDLRSAEVSISRNVEIHDLSYQAVLPEILKVLKSACTTHRLPLAQTWVSCILQGKGGCRHSEENLQNCISPVDSACYIGDARVQGFYEACSDHHLLKDQGIVGKAFRTNEPCFSPDVTVCSRMEYPLSHYARMFGLKAAVAIRLRSICSGSSDFVLEFFLPVDCVDPEEQKQVLTSLSTVIQNVCQTLRVVTDKELQEESGIGNYSTVMSIGTEAPSEDHFAGQANHLESGATAPVSQSGKPREVLIECSDVRTGQRGSNSGEDATVVTNTSVTGDGSSHYTNRTGEKRRGKSDQVITLQVLRQHFAGSLKDAAKKLGVCPTTLKRICRQHGVQRWPSRKIKKVGHSLQKIQRVIDSVQGASGVLQIDSFYSNFPELASPKASERAHFSNYKPSENKKSDKQQATSTVLRPLAAASTSPSSSCSHSSSSSQCCSSGAQPSYSFSVANPIIKDRLDTGTLKRTRTEANLLISNDEPKPLPRSKSHVSLSRPEKSQDHLTGLKSHDTGAPRIKVTYGEDNIRFRLKNEWRYTDLVNEISRRFGVGDPSRFQLKYLDDDAEWVLLTCDADLEECIDVCQSSRNNSIKLSFLPNSSTRSQNYFSNTVTGPWSL